MQASTSTVGVQIHVEMVCVRKNDEDLGETGKISIF